jgi:predicted transcriptional regulator of viral defense system
MTARTDLWDVALDNYGYVTVRDAIDLGIDRLTVDKLAHRGGLEHAARGVYRFTQFPTTEFDPYMLAVKWTGVPEACLSHDTALAAYDVCDINPDRIHITVPTAKRLRRRGGELYVVHYQDLAPKDITWWEQIPTATLETAIGQCIDTGVPTYLLRQAITTATDRGRLRKDAATELGDRLEARA